MNKKHNRSLRYLRGNSPNWREWFRIEDTDIVSNGEIALRLYANRLKVKVWSGKESRYAKDLIPPEGETWTFKRSLDSDVTGTYYIGKGGKRVLVNNHYLRIAGNPQTLIATCKVSRSKIYGVEGTEPVLVDDAQDPSIWICPIQEGV